MGGLFGIASADNCTQDLFYGTDYHSHLGTRRGGLALHNHSGFTRSIHNIENNYFRSKFEADLPKLTGNKGIGVISDTDPQPLIIGCHLGTFAIVTVGKIANLEELALQAYRQRLVFSENSGTAVNPTELTAMLISQQGSFEEGIRYAQECIKGSLSLLLLTADGIYAARDRLGRTPLILGRRCGAVAVCSETAALPNLGLEKIRDLGPAEVVLITADGWETRMPAGSRMQICTFLWVYYGYPASSYEGINVETVRYRCGQALARRDEWVPDYVAGIPDSGIGHALGYANEKSVAYRRPYVKYTPTWPRSFMPQNQQWRDIVARMKLIPIKELIQDRRILFCDDSIVRGTQLKDTIRLLFDAGAQQVHMRIACPTLIHPCEFLNFSTSRSSLDLAGRKAIQKIEGTDGGDLQPYAVADTPQHRAMVEQIRQALNLTSLRYQKMEDLVDAVGLAKTNLCTHCWDGTSYF
jgi:amidophosphoribosyltransferase